MGYRGCSRAPHGVKAAGRASPHIPFPDSGISNSSTAQQRSPRDSHLLQCLSPNVPCNKPRLTCGFCSRLLPNQAAPCPFSGRPGPTCIAGGAAQDRLWPCSAHSVQPSIRLGHEPKARDGQSPSEAAHPSQRYCISQCHRAPCSGSDTSTV